MEISFNIEKDCRKFKAGTEIKLATRDKGILYLCGANGSGKSTLLHIMRSKMDSLQKVNIKIHDGCFNDKYKEAAMEPIEMKGFDYDEAFYLDSVIDNPTSFMNAASAGAFILGGGQASQFRSRGENSLIELELFRRKVESYLIDNYGSIGKWKESGKRGLVVLDEIDEGLDMRLQFRFNGILDRKFIEELGVDIICVTHNPICMKSVCDCDVEVFDIQTLITMIPDEYIMLLTGMKLSFEEIDFGNEA